MKRFLYVFVSVITVLTIAGCSTMVSFTSVPPEADVYINDIYEGKTPVEKKKSKYIFKNSKIRID